MKKTMSFLFAGFTAMAFSQNQIGVNTTSPRATLDVQIESSNLNTTTNEGVIAPQISKNRVAQIQTPIEGTLLYVSDTTYTSGGNTITDNRVAKITEKGYYFYNGSLWLPTSDPNIYAQDGVLSSARTVNMGTYNLSFTGTGNVGIGTNTPTQKLEVGGNIVASGYVKGAALDLNSDKRLKTKINAIDDKSTQKLRLLNPVTYYWNTEGKAKGGNDKLQYGLIAQEIEKVFPEMVNTDEKGYKSVNYIELIPVLLKAIQEQQKEIEILKSKIK